MKYYLDMFSGIGGFALAAYWAGLRFNEHYFSEVEPYCIQLYKKRFSEVIELGGIENVNYKELPKGEWLVTGGFPCQPHSMAGKRKGSNDERDLWNECVRMLRELRPRVALFENVRGLLSSPGKEEMGAFFNRVLSDIQECGYACEWKVISAASVGAPHRRERVWIVAYPQGERCKEVGQEFDYRTKGCREKPEDWAKLFSIATGAYHIHDWKRHEHLLTGAYDGLPEELDSIKGAGNAIVPQVAEMIFNLPIFECFKEDE